ncbi:MAG TPA: CoB--CoM heterodisulfide reductase iron-sulfur subunit B family protein [Candidatus Dormibacteraeota bacterium]|nr:CoB--CoM heterodisulfide reductase iron-sulfur subunit B family protein [Candidatus Dormibacteraeota bacterium]
MSDAALRYAYYTGCVPKQSTRELDVATRLVCEGLGIELTEMTGAPCCGAGDVDMARPVLNRAVNAVTLAQAERDGLDIMTICNVCTLNLRAVNAALQGDPAELAAANEALAAGGYSYAGGVEVTHLLWVLYRDLGPERLAAAVRRPLRGLRTAAFYGCQVLRPADLHGVDDPDDPRSMEAIFDALGAEPVAYDGRTRCCGWPIIVAREETATLEAGSILASAKAAGAELVVTPCPLCHISLDGYQAKAASLRGGEDIRLPVLHLPQLIGLALGMSPRELRLHRHVTSTGTVLARLGLALD